MSDTPSTPAEGRRPHDTMPRVRVAMWSGPRNISTAMMRSFENRPDTHVVDEPFYAYYLQETGYQHPARNEILASQPTDWRDVVDQLRGSVPAGNSIYYQKLMSHHLLDEISLDWMLDPSFRHVFLIRSPAAMLVSLSKVLGDFTIEQTGLPQQVRLFEMLREQTGELPLVIDARDVLSDPRRALSLLCQRLGIAFVEAMLRWPPGPRETDGVWGPHWYERLYQTTGFSADVTRSEPLPDSCKSLLPACDELYERLAAGRFLPNASDESTP